MLVEFFNDVGFLVGVFNVVMILCDCVVMVGNVFVDDKWIVVMSFIGLICVGQFFVIVCVKVFKLIVFEFGGKNLMIVCNDVDFDCVVDLVFFGLFLYQGQICMFCDKILVDWLIYDVFVEKLVVKMVNFVFINFDEQICVVGLIINFWQLCWIEVMVDVVVKVGVKVECGGEV